MFIIFYTGLVAAYIVYCFQYNLKQIDKPTTFILLLLGFIMWAQVIFA